MNKKRTEALKLFLKGVGRDTICKQIDLSHQTLDNWRKKYGWDKLYGESQANIRRSVGIDIEKEKAEDLKVINTLQNVFKQEINRQIEQKTLASLPKNTQIYTGLLKAKWEILMPKTISQYNFMKQENNLGYTLEIIDPNETSMEAKSQAVSGLAPAARQADN